MDGGIADLAAHLEDPEYLSEWLAGIEESKEAAEAAGMKPLKRTAWWDAPWLDEEKHIEAMRVASSDEQEGETITEGFDTASEKVTTYVSQQTLEFEF